MAPKALRVVNAAYRMDGCIFLKLVDEAGRSLGVRLDRSTAARKEARVQLFVAELPAPISAEEGAWLVALGTAAQVAVERGSANESAWLVAFAQARVVCEEPKDADSDAWVVGLVHELVRVVSSEAYHHQTVWVPPPTPEERLEKLLSTRDVKGAVREYRTQNPSVGMKDALEHIKRLMNQG